jgi:biopolymer transport protein ExbD
MSLRGRTKSETTESIDISPLIDMVFILLIFFMVSTTFVKDMDLEINRPNAESAEKASPDAVRLYIDSRGETYLDGDPVRTWMIQSRLRDLMQASGSETVLLVTDENVPARRLVEVVDQARLAGAEVGVATEREAGRG